MENKANIERIMELTKRLLKEKPTKEQSLKTLVGAGILDTNGNFTEPYSILSTYFVSK